MSSSNSTTLGFGSEEAFNALVTGLERGQFYKYVNVAALTVFVTEYIATLDFEVQYMWPMKLNLVSVLFFITRYMPVVDMTVTLYTEQAANMTQPLCYILAKTYVWLIYAGMAAAEGLLTLRVWVLYGKGKKLSLFLAAMYGGSFVASGVKIYLSLASLQVMIIPLPGLPNVCSAKSYDQQLYLYWVFMIIVDAVSCILLLVQLISAYKLGGLSNLMTVVYRDGVIFYIVLLCFSVVNIFAIIMLPADISSLLTAPERVMHAVLAARVILQTRHQVYSDKHSIITLHTIPSFDAARPEQFSHGSPAMSFTGNYTSPVNVTSPSRASPVFVSVSVNVQPLRPISGSGSLVSPLSLSARPLSVSSPIFAGPMQLSPTSLSSPPSRASSASKYSSGSSHPSSPRSSSGSGAIKVEPRAQEQQQVVTDRGSPGPIFEAAMEKQRQRQYARIRRSFRTAQRYANAAAAAAAMAAQRESSDSQQCYHLPSRSMAAQRESSDSQQCYHLPSQRLTRSPYPAVGGEDEPEDELGESENEPAIAGGTRQSWGQND